MWKSLISALAGALLLPAGARAAQSSATVSPSINIGGSCAVTSGTLDFGSVGSLSAAINGQGSFTVNCGFFVFYNIGLDAGANGGGVTTRKMKGGTGGQLIGYALYQDAARSQNWGMTVGTDTLAAFSFFGGIQTYNVYGQIPAQAMQPQGGYLDNVRIIVTY